ncbi:hypothetical protein ACQP2T_22895 [Nonomuraea sp. CA-143628]|uniref:hypothetical protein n=1 Tax=Nonomuraea sp. CA-143628 TaxID=3239997 RepID=UPI003D8F24AD
MLMRKAILAPLLTTLTLFGAVAVADTSYADSPTLWVNTSGKARCAADWFSAPNQFGFADISQDGHFCYIQWNWISDVNKGSRFSLRPDQSVGLQFRARVNPGRQPTIWWKLCREVSGPDNCTGVRADRT